MIPKPLRTIGLLHDIGIARCLPLKTALNQHVVPGLHNRSWRVISDAGDWVVRINGAGHGIDRAAERQVLQRVCDIGLGPPLVACEPDLGYLITGFLQLPRWSKDRFDEPAQVAALARSLRQLHALHLPSMQRSDWQTELLSSLERSPLASQSRLQAGIDALLVAMAEGSFDQGPLALCHHDLHGGNILGLGLGLGLGPVQFIDWEYARLTHPAMDLAYLIQYHDLDPEQRSLLLQAYYGRADRDTAQLMVLAVRLAQYQELLWLARCQQLESLPNGPAARLRALKVVLC